MSLWWLIDNQNVERFLAKGSRKLCIMMLLLNTLGSARALLLDVQPVWVSRDNPFLLKADAISKGVNTDNWEVAVSDWTQLSGPFGPFSVDLFATNTNSKCEHFSSRYREKGSLGMDSFAQNWEGEHAYAAPPVSLVLRTIRKIVITEMMGVLIILLWKNAKFWTFGFRDRTHLNTMFNNVQIVCMHTLAWEFSKKDVIEGKEIQFL
jgi:hypothetical protein